MLFPIKLAVNDEWVVAGEDDSNDEAVASPRVGKTDERRRTESNRRASGVLFARLRGAGDFSLGRDSSRSFAAATSLRIESGICSTKYSHSSRQAAYYHDFANHARYKRIRCEACA